MFPMLIVKEIVEMSKAYYTFSEVANIFINPTGVVTVSTIRT